MSTIREPRDYLLQPEPFAQLRAKARKAFWESRVAPDDLPTVREIMRISPGDPRFQAEVENGLLMKEVEKTVEVIRRLMELEPTTPKRSAPSTPKRASSGLPFSKPPEEGEQKFPVPADLPPPPGMKRLPLITGPDDLELLAAKVRGAMQRGTLAGVNSALAKQVLAAQLLYDQSAPFGEALMRCLGGPALEKCISPCYLPDAAPEEYPAKRKALLAAFIKAMQQEEPAFIPAPPKAPPRPALPPEWAASPASAKPASPKTRSHSGGQLSSSPKAAAPLVRAKTQMILSDQLHNYPPSLQDPSPMRRLLEGAVILQYLFPERFGKLFKKGSEVVVIVQLKELGTMTRYLSLNFPVCVEQCFKGLMQRERETVDAVFEKLLSKHTISKIRKAPKIPTDFPLGKAFRQPPFDQEAAAESLLGVLAYTKYMLAGCYSEYSKEEKRIIDLVLQAGQIRDMLRLDFATSLKIVLSTAGPVNDSDVERMTTRANLGRKPVSESFNDSFDGEKELARALDVPFLKHAFLFAAYLERAQLRLSARSPYTVRVAELLLAIGERLKKEPLTLEGAVKSSFTLNGLKRLFHSEDTEKNIRELVSAFHNLRPSFYSKHTAFDSEDAFLRLLKAEKPAGADPQTAIVYECLQQIRKRMEADASLPWQEVLLHFLNTDALRSLFRSENDVQNSQELARCIDAMLPKAP